MNLEDRKQKTQEIFLGIFKEENISDEELKEFILESYIQQGYNYSSFDEIPIEDMEEAISDTCEAAGLKFENFDDIIDHFYKERN